MRRLTIKAKGAIEKEEELELLTLAKNGDNVAMQRIIAAYVRLIQRDAKKWVGMDCYQDDLVQAGILGLMRAVVLFDSSFETKFITYAGNWWKQAIDKEAKRQKFQGRSGTGGMYKGWASNILKALNRHNEDALEASKEIGKPLEVVEAVQLLHKPVRSTSANRYKNGKACADVESSLINNAPNQEDVYLDAELYSVLWSLVHKLPSRLKRIVVFRYCDDMTLGQIGEELNVSGERVRQLLSDAISILRTKMKRLEVEA
jgi:RNA polymerase sigma factor (sigma-70 family)